MLLDLLAALAADRWLRKRFYELSILVWLWSLGDGSRGGTGNTSRHH